MDNTNEDTGVTDDEAGKLDELFNKFKTTKSNFAASKEDDKQKNLVTEKVVVEAKEVAKEEIQEISEEQTIKFGMLLKVGNFIVSGLHVVLFNMISKYKVTMDDIKLDDDELTSLESYGSIKGIQNFLSKIPVWVFPVLQIEFIYIDKWQDAVEIKKKEEKINLARIAKDKEEKEKNEIPNDYK